jgi:hypothetical protein
MDIILDQVKTRLYSDAPLSLDELADLLSLVEVYPQPIGVVERLKKEIEQLHIRGFSASSLDSADEQPDRDSRIAITDVIRDLRKRRNEAVGNFMGRAAIERPKTYLAYLKNVIEARMKEEESQKDTYTTLARRLAVMSKFQRRLQTIRERWDLPILSWVKLMQVQWVAPQDLIESLIKGCGRPEKEIDRKLPAGLRVACREVKLNPADGFGAATALLAFNVKPEDLLSHSPHLKVMQHFVLQKADTMLARVRVETDDTGLLSGALVALAHLDALMPPNTKLPDSVMEWLRYARQVHDGLQLNSNNPEDIDIAMEDVGGRLTNLKIPEPKVSIAITPEMNQDDMKAAFKVAHSQAKHIRLIPNPTQRKWDRWPNYDEQIYFYSLYQQEYAKKPYEAIPRAIKRYNKDRINYGLPKRFLEFDDKMIAQANELIYQVEAIQKQESL